jgi:hypothetical protein
MGQDKEHAATHGLSGCGVSVNPKIHKLPSVVLKYVMTHPCTSPSAAPATTLLPQAPSILTLTPPPFHVGPPHHSPLLTPPEKLTIQPTHLVQNGAEVAKDLSLHFHVHPQQPVEQLVGGEGLAVQQTNSGQLRLGSITPADHGSLAPDGVAIGACKQPTRQQTGFVRMESTVYHSDTPAINNTTSACLSAFIEF